MAIGILSLLLLCQSPSIQIKDVSVGKGPTAAVGDVVTVTYTGKLSSGKVFASTDKKPPFAFKLDADDTVFAGWHKGVLGMRVGGKRHLVVPPALGYGSTEQPNVPANSTLTLDVELIHVQKRNDKPTIQIKELKKGSGRAVKTGDKVQVHYRGSFLNGFQFDTSRGGAPYSVTVGVGEVIKGFDQGLLGMKVGTKRSVTIPYELAYGKNGRSGIPRYETLVFELELVQFKN